jgi:hypothetical protein
MGAYTPKFLGCHAFLLHYLFRPARVYRLPDRRRRGRQVLEITALQATQILPKDILSDMNIAPALGTSFEVNHFHTTSLVAHAYFPFTRHII